MGRLGRHRVFVVHPRDPDFALLSDLAGVTVLPYESDPGVDRSLRNCLSSVCNNIKTAIRQLGPRLPTPKLVDRGQVHRVVGTLSRRLQNVAGELRISGFDCRHVIVDKRIELQDALERNVRVKIMCLDPQSEAATGLLEKVPSHYPNSASLRESIRSTQAILAGWRERFRDRLEIRYLPVIPAVGMFIADPNTSSGVLKVELYTHEHRQAIISRPHLVIASGTVEWRDYFLHQWELYWNASRDPSDEELRGLPGPDQYRPPQDPSGPNGSGSGRSRRSPDPEESLLTQA
jgi:hypothetical protein